MKIEIPDEILQQIISESATFAKFFSDKNLNVEKNLLGKLWDFNPDGDFSEKIQRIKYLRELCADDSYDGKLFRDYCQEEYIKLHSQKHPDLNFYAGNDSSLGLLAAKTLVEYWFNY